MNEENRQGKEQHAKRGRISETGVFRSTKTCFRSRNAVSASPVLASDQQTPNKFPARKYELRNVRIALDVKNSQSKFKYIYTKEYFLQTEKNMPVYFHRYGADVRRLRRKPALPLNTSVHFFHEKNKDQNENLVAFTQEKQGQLLMLNKESNQVTVTQLDPRTKMEDLTDAALQTHLFVKRGSNNSDEFQCYENERHYLYADRKLFIQEKNEDASNKFRFKHHKDVRCQQFLGKEEEQQ